MLGPAAKGGLGPTQLLLVSVKTETSLSCPLMFTPSDPRFDEILELAEHAIGEGLLDRQRPRWRVLVRELLGSINEGAPSAAERRQELRAPLELEVDILEPDDMASLATSSVGSGGLCLRIAEVIPSGTPVLLSIKLAQRRQPLMIHAQVAWSKPGQLGAAFTDVFQGDRELLEGLAVTALLSGSPSSASAAGS